MPRTPTPRLALALLSALLLSPNLSLAEEAKPPGVAAAPVAARPSDERIVYQVVPMVGGDHHSVTTTLEAVPVRASDGRPLPGELLYQALGRPDLVAEYRARQTRGRTIVGVGAVVTLGGLVYTVTRPSPDTSGPIGTVSRGATDQMAAVTAGMLVSLAGCVIMTVGAFTDPNPVGEAERQRLVDEHNRGRAGGPGGGPPNAAGAAGDDRPSLSFQAGLLPGGGMAGLALAF
jgi:hypothetical protein